MTTKTVRRAAAMMATLGASLPLRAGAQYAPEEPTLTGTVSAFAPARPGERTIVLGNLPPSDIKTCMDAAPQTAMAINAGASVACNGSDGNFYGSQACYPPDPNGVVGCMATIGNQPPVATGFRQEKLLSDFRLNTPLIGMLKLNGLVR